MYVPFVKLSIFKDLIENRDSLEQNTIYIFGGGILNQWRESYKEGGNSVFKRKSWRIFFARDWSHQCKK